MCEPLGHSWPLSSAHHTGTGSDGLRFPGFWLGVASWEGGWRVGGKEKPGCFSPCFSVSGRLQHRLHHLYSSSRCPVGATTVPVSLGAPSRRAPLPPSPLSHQPKGVSGFLKLLISLSPVQLLSCMLNSLRCIPIHY